MAEEAKTFPLPDPAAIFEAEQSYQGFFLVKAAVDLDDTYTELSGMCRSAVLRKLGCFN